MGRTLVRIGYCLDCNSLARCSWLDYSPRSWVDQCSCCSDRLARCCRPGRICRNDWRRGWYQHSLDPMRPDTSLCPGYKSKCRFQPRKLQCHWRLHHMDYIALRNLSPRCRAHTRLNIDDGPPHNRIDCSASCNLSSRRRSPPDHHSPVSSDRHSVRSSYLADNQTVRRNRFPPLGLSRSQEVSRQARDTDSIQFAWTL